MRGLIDKLTAAVVVTGADLVHQRLLLFKESHLQAQAEAQAQAQAAAVAAVVVDDDGEVASILSGALTPVQLVAALRGRRTLAPPLPLGSPSATHETHRRYGII